MIIVGQSRAAGGGGDPYWSDVVALIHCNGADESTTFTDESDTGHSLTASGNAQVDTGQKKWGSASLQLDGSADYIYAADHADWDFTGDFTMEAWIRFDTSVTSYTLFCNTNQAASVAGVALYGSATTITFLATSGGGSWNLGNISGSWSPSADTWYHIVAECKSGTLKIFVDGVEKASGSLSSVTSGTHAMWFGAFDGAADYCHSGWIDDIRITNGTARYDHSVTVPTGEFPDS